MPQSLRNPDDFTLRIVVTAPEEWHPSLAGPRLTEQGKPSLVDDESAPTRPFKKSLHGIGMPAAQPAQLRPKPEPLSSDEYARLLRRARACRRIAWARNMLRKFNFEDRA